jgi:hypothetical protein
LKHSDPVVREGAILGLIPHMSRGIKQVLKKHLEKETSEVIKNYIREII